MTNQSQSKSNELNGQRKIVRRNEMKLIANFQRGLSRGGNLTCLWYGVVPFFRVPFVMIVPDLWVWFLTIFCIFRIYGYSFLSEFIYW